MSSEPVVRRRDRRKLVAMGVGLVVIAAVAVLFVRTLARNWDEVREQQIRFDPLMIVATLLFTVAVPVSGLLWGRIVNTLTPGPRITRTEAISVHCASWLLKYIPGQVGSVVNKVMWGQRRGLSRTLVVVTFIYENLFLQVASIVPAVAILAVTNGFGVFTANVGTLLLPLLIFVPIALLMNQRVLYAVLSFGTTRLLKKPLPREFFLSSRKVLQFQIEFLLPRVLNGVGFVVTAAALAPTPADTWLPLAAAYVLAGGIGILAVFVPSGLGVREAVVTLFASAYMPLPQAVVLALVARLLSTVADGVVAVIYGGIRSTRPQEHGS